jgi:DNA ligase D-like protein (predicted 3'-phosphoesterase)
MSKRQSDLQAYRRKRDFTKTPEPEPAEGKAKSGDETIYVIQKHDATRLHYDFRLEIDGVLKSWAVPKGPSTDPKDKRLAMPTEDHPMGYADFEGVIPEGEYGAGTVLVWDIGFYRNITEKRGRPIPTAEAVENGHITVFLTGKKLRGGYAFTRTGPSGGRARWILVKIRDRFADETANIVEDEPRSAITDRTIEEVAEAGTGRSARIS